MPKYKTLIEGEDGWTEWVMPNPEGYKIACCDCGLIHDLEFEAFKVIEDDEARNRVRIKPLSRRLYGVRFRARRDMRATAQRRRKRKTDATR